MRSLTSNTRKFAKHSPKGAGTHQIQIRNYGEISRAPVEYKERLETEERHRPKFSFSKNSEMERRINKTIAELEAELIKTRKRLKEQTTYNDPTLIRRGPIPLGRTAPEVRE